jgi:hypothetical protein
MELFFPNRLSLLTLIFMTMYTYSIASATVINDTSLISTDVMSEDTEPPVVEITSPLDGSSVNGTIIVEVSVSDNRGSLPSYSVLINGGEVSTTIPYRWDTVSFGDGYYVIRVEATDMAGNTGSDEIGVFVQTQLVQSEFLDNFDTFDSATWLIPERDLPDNGRLVDWNNIYKNMVLFGTEQDWEANFYSNFVYDRSRFPVFKVDFMFDGQASGLKIGAEGWTDYMSYRFHGIILKNNHIYALWNDGSEHYSVEPIIELPIKDNWYTTEIEFTDINSKLYCYPKGELKPDEPAHIFTFADWHPRFHFWNYSGTSFIDNVAVTLGSIPEGGTISGYVNLEGRTDQSEQITFELRYPGATTPIPTYQPLNDEDPHTPGTQITTDFYGGFTLIDVPAGNYDLTAKGSNTLRAKQVDIMVFAGNETSSLQFNLLGGDANNDNSVGTGDMLILKSAWLSSQGDENWDVRADFNGDGSIGTGDMLIMKNNWLVSGEE